MNLKQTIKRILEQIEVDKKIQRAEKLKKLRDEIGLKHTLDAVGGYENYLRLIYDGNLEEYFKTEDVNAIEFSEGPNMYLDELLVESLNLENFGKDEKILGKFGWGNKSKTSSKFPYSLDARLRKIKYSDGRFAWKVVGISGSHGFGYYFISKRETLGPKFRRQIFEQIIDKFNLKKYINLK